MKTHRETHAFAHKHTHTHIHTHRAKNLLGGAKLNTEASSYSHKAALCGRIQQTGLGHRPQGRAGSAGREAQAGEAGTERGHRGGEKMPVVSAPGPPPSLLARARRVVLRCPPRRPAGSYPAS